MGWKDRLKAIPAFRTGWGAMRAAQLHRAYAARRDHYARLAAERALLYRPETVQAELRHRLAARGWQPRKRRDGEIHTFAILPDVSWHHQLLPDLRRLGPVSLFDYVAHGFTWDEFARADARAIARRRAMNDLILPALRRAMAERPVDWIFLYNSGLEMSAATLRAITDETGIPTVGLFLDDKHCWDGPWMGDHRAGTVDICAALDLAWTSASVACEWHLAEGSRPLYLPEGFDADTCSGAGETSDLGVSFVGAAYGVRPLVVEHLRRHGIDVATFGAGWPGTGFAGDPARIFRRSRVNLGIGAIGYSEHLTNLKGRDFDVPACGGGVYVTSFNADLARHFRVGEEIACYRGRDEMVEMVRYYLHRPEEARAMAVRARERCWNEHRWLHRYRTVLGVLGVL